MSSKDTIETKFFSVLDSVQNEISKNREGRANCAELIKTLEDDIRSLKKSVLLLTDQVAIDSLNATIEDKEKTKSLNERYITGYDERVKQLRDNLSTLQPICPHVKTVVDREDYHRNETYYRCVRCDYVY